MKYPNIKFSKILWNTKKKRMTGVLTNPDDFNQCCALGVIAFACGWKPKVVPSPFNEGENRIDNSEEAYEFINQCLAEQGSGLMVHHIYNKNDDGWSFRKIAKWLKAQGL